LKYSNEPLFKGTVTIEDLLEDGSVLARIEGKVVFLKGGIPGDVVEISVLRKKKGYFLGRIDSFISYSDSRVTPLCSHFGHCGGCKWQSLNYDEQLKFKADQVKDALERIGGFEGLNILPIIPAPSPYFYRNKLEFTFSSKRYYESRSETEETVLTNALGFHAPGIFDKAIHINACYLMDETADKIRNRVYSDALSSGMPFYDIRHHQGFFRNLVIRKAENTGERMVVLVTTSDPDQHGKKLIEPLVETFPEVTSWLQIENDRMNDHYGGLPVKVLFGNPAMHEILGEYTFRISSGSFFQTNSKQAKVLYDVVKSFMPEKKPALLYDLYCGTGTIGIYLSTQAEKIVGVEFVEDAVEDARRNCALNNIQHLSFYSGDMVKVLSEAFVEQEGKPEVIITDPPRAGMDEKICRKILSIGAENIIYVSCNPATQARDIKFLSEQYDMVKIQPVDMFPQTSHVETVALLRLRNV